MESAQYTPHANQTPKNGCMHEPQENYSIEECSKTHNQEKQTQVPPLSMNAQASYGQEVGAKQGPQMGPQTMPPGMAEQSYGIMGQGQPAGIGQSMSESHHDSGETCSCQGGMERYAYGASVQSAPMTPPSFAGPQGMPQMGPVGQPQPQAAMNGGGCADRFGPQPVQAVQIMQGMPSQYGPMAAPPQGPMMQGMPLQHGPMAAPPQAPMMPGMPVHSQTAPQYGSQNPGQYGPQAQAQPSMPMTGHSCSGAGHTGHGVHGHPGQPAHDQNQYQYGQLMDIVGDMMAGDPDVSKIMRFFQSCDTQFLKGALIGAVGMFLLTNDTVKSTIVDMISGVWGTFQKTSSEKSPEDEESDVKTETKTAPKTSSRTASKTASKTTEK